MRIADMNWMQVEAYLKQDDRAVVPLGCVEQHAYMSLATDAILAERVALEAAEPLGVPVFPALAYGVTPYFLAFPGTVSLRVETYVQVIRDMLNSLGGHGFRRIVFVNGHGGNTPAEAVIGEWIAQNPSARVVIHHWWSAPQFDAAVRAIDPVASHASWKENFPWTRVAASPSETKPMVDAGQLRTLPPEEVKRLLGDGNYGGAYEKPQEQLDRIWEAGVLEVRSVIENI
jgi:creatinine amidohydrolase